MGPEERKPIMNFHKKGFNELRNVSLLLEIDKSQATILTPPYFD
jgi:hypothetical protein